MVLRRIGGYLVNHLPPQWNVSLDLHPGHQLPRQIFGTEKLALLRPDIILLNVQNNELILSELSCPLPINVAWAHEHKTQKYLPLIQVAKHHGWISSLQIITVPCQSPSIRGLTELLHLLKISDSAQPLEQECIRIVCQHTTSILNSQELVL